ncbi:MAG: carboxypeptidase regulatory-like domain-containing protein [Archangium sp.]|nr:carboxypeptidase regulatory-like domain-containing protein [Archangium sp.]
MRDSIFRTSSLIWLVAAALSACGPAGVISGKVTVEGGTAGGIAVIIYGPQSAAAVTGDDGAFSVGSLPDGKYVVRATVRGADVEELSVTTTITQGAASPEPILAFRASTAKVSGRVVMADGSGPENLTVTAVGPETRGARTAADGSFSFENLKTGAYLISVEAKDTLEGRVAVGVNASGPVDAGELRLTPIGRLNGIVTYNTMPVANAPVVVTGTRASTVTDAMGRFSLLDVPTGNQAVLVRVGSAPFFRSATAMVMVARGTNPDLTMALTDDAPRTGTVTGVVTFHGPRSPRDITVSALGSGVTATPQLNGAYSLTLPVGVWDVTATAPQHPPRLLGRVTVIEGQAQSLPGAEVSWYRPIWRSTSDISPPNSLTFGALNDNVPWTLVGFNDSAPRLALVNSTTADFRILAVGSTAGHRISKGGKYAGWYVPGTSTVFVYEIATAVLSVFSAQQPPPVVVSTDQIEFSSDESAIFIRRRAVDPTPNPTILNLTRIKFATASNVEIFPASGSATQILSTNVDRWFVRDAANDVRLVTPTIDVPQVFTQVQQFSATPTAWATTNCGATCQMMVLSPTSIAAAVRDNSVNPLPGGVTNFNSLGSNFDNRGDYPCFLSAGNAFCVRSADGNHFALAAVPLSFKLNEAGDRVIWTLPSGANRAVREEAMPPTGSTNLGSNGVGWNIGWISPTRAYAYEVSGGPRTLHLVKTTGATTTTTSDPDVGSQAVIAQPPLLVVPQSTTSRWRAYLGDGPVRLVDVPTNLPVLSVAVRGLGTGTITKYAGVTFDTVSSWIIDENMATVRQNYVGISSGASRSGAVEWMSIARPGGLAAIFVFNTGVLLEYQENNVTLSAPVGQPGVLGYLGLGEDQRTIYAAGFQP